jgi:hypothetical protein
MYIIFIWFLFRLSYNQFFALNRRILYMKRFLHSPENLYIPV